MSQSPLQVPTAANGDIFTQPAEAAEISFPGADSYV